MHRYSIIPLAGLLILGLSGFIKKSKPENVPVFSIAYYQFQHIKDTTQSGKVWTEDFLLAFDQQKSVYLSQTKLIQDSTQMAILKKADEQNSQVINMGIYRPTTADQVYVQNEQVTIIKNFDDQLYQISDPQQKTVWKMDNETKSLLGYTCQKATGIVKGRTYTVWFTTDIPAEFGPWKLFGLPGLILEAYDESGRIKFTCTKIAMQSHAPAAVSLSLPPDAIKTSDVDYARMEKAYQENLSTDFADADGIKIESVNQTSGNTKPSGRKISVNFPLELKN